MLEVFDDTVTAQNESVDGRVCQKCGVWKTRMEFFADGRRIGFASMRAVCRRCTRNDVRKRREADPERFREAERKSDNNRDLDTREKDRLSQRKARLKQKFGITFDTLNTMLFAQDGKCAICDKALVVSAPGRGRNDLACVDHNHKTGRVRGVLCNRCNTAIGLLNDDETQIKKALAYLRKFSR